MQQISMKNNQNSKTLPGKKYSNKNLNPWKLAHIWKGQTAYPSCILDWPRRHNTWQGKTPNKFWSSFICFLEWKTITIQSRKRIVSYSLISNVILGWILSFYGLWRWFKSYIWLKRIDCLYWLSWSTTNKVHKTM